MVSPTPSVVTVKPTTSRSIFVVRVDVADSVTWVENVSRLLPLLSALRLLRSLCLLRRCLLTFRHCALQVRDGAIEKVPSRIDGHAFPITPERKKQRLRLTKRVLARAIARLASDGARCFVSADIVNETTYRVVADAESRFTSCRDKIRTIGMSCALHIAHLATISSSTPAQLRHFRCQGALKFLDRKKIFAINSKSGVRTTNPIANRTNRVTVIRD